MRLVIATLALAMLSGDAIGQTNDGPSSIGQAVMAEQVVSNYLENPLFIIALLTFLTTLGNVILSFRTKASADTAVAKVEEVHLSVNSRMDTLIKKTEEEAHAAGVKQETDMADLLAKAEAAGAARRTRTKARK